TIDLPAPATTLLLSPDDAFLYATHGLRGTISVIRTAPAPAIVRTITLGAVAPSGMDINKAGTTLYVSMFAMNAVAAVDLSKDTFVTIPVSGGPNQVALTPDGRFLYVANLSTNTVSVIDTLSNT